MMNLFEFYEKQYYHQLDRRVQLTNSLSIPLGVLTLLCGLIGYYATSFTFSGSIDSIIFSFLLIVSLVVIVIVVVFLFRSYWSYVYHYISDTEEIREYYSKLLEYYKTVDNINAVNNSLNEIENVIIQKYSKNATDNSLNNDTKSKFLHRSNSTLVYLSAVVFLLTIVFFWNKYNYSNQTPNHPTTYFQNYYGVKTMAKDSNDSKSDNKPAPQPPPKTIDKPVPPPDKHLREGEDKTIKRNK